MQLSFKTDLSFKLFTSNPVVQDLDTGLKQLQPRQVLRTGNKDMDIYLFIFDIFKFLHWLLKKYTHPLKAAILFKAVAAQ